MTIIIIIKKIIKLFLFLKINKRGEQKITRVKKLKVNRSISANPCSNSGFHDQLYAHKFHGNPENNFALRQSPKLNTLENNKIEIKLCFKKGPTNKLLMPKNNPKKIGKPNTAKGIKNLKDASKVNE